MPRDLLYSHNKPFGDFNRLTLVASAAVLSQPSTQPGEPKPSPLGTRNRRLSSEYMLQQSCNCLRLLRQLIPWALVLALLKAGSSMAASIAMMAITTSNSIRVKAWRRQVGRGMASRITENGP